MHEMKTRKMSRLTKCKYASICIPNELHPQITMHSLSFPFFSLKKSQTRSIYSLYLKLHHASVFCHQQMKGTGRVGVGSAHHGPETPGQWRREPDYASCRAWIRSSPGAPFQGSGGNHGSPPWEPVSQQTLQKKRKES